MKQSEKTEVIDLDDFSLDDFDFGDPMLDGQDPSNDRNPVTDFARGAAEGVKTTLTDPSLYINTMRDSLPEGYGSAYDTVVDVKDKGLGLYNEVVQELRPGIRDLKIIGRRAKSAVDSLLPDSMSKKLDEWLRDKDVSKDGQRTATREELRDESMTNELGELFKMQAEEKQTERTDSLIRETVENKRFATNTQQLDGIRRSLGSLVGYQDQITAKYQRKSLELQYRSYYAQRDLLEVTKASVVDFTTLMKNIQKNTALPESEKIKLNELATQLMKERLIGKAQDKLAPSVRDFAGKFTENLGVRIKEKANEFKDAVATFAMGAEQSDMLSEMGGSASEMAGEIAGESGTRWVGERVGKLLRPIFAKNKKVLVGGTGSAYLAENAQNLIKDHLEKNPSRFGLIQMIQEAALDASRVRRETRVGYDEMAKATEPVPYDNLSRKSLTEIIPGWLARIYQVNRELLGYREELQTYDHATNQYTSVSSLGQNVTSRIMDENSVARTREYTESLTKSLLGESEDKDLVNKVEVMFTRLARDKGYLNVNDISNLTMLEKYGLSPEQARTFSEAAKQNLDVRDRPEAEDEAEDYDMFNESLVGKAKSFVKGGYRAAKSMATGARDYLDIDQEASARRLQASRDLERLRDVMPKPYEILNMYANTGNREALRAAGLLTRKGDEDHVDEEAFFRNYLNTVQGAPNETTASESPTSSFMGNTTYHSRVNRPSDSGLSEETQQLSEIASVLRDLKAQASEVEIRQGDSKSLEDTIRDASAKEEVRKATELLEGILTALQAGMPVRVLGNVKVTEAGIEGDDSEPVDDSIWGDVKSAAGRLRSAGRRGYGHASRYVKGAWNFMDAPRKAMFRVGGNIASRARKWGGSILDTAKSLRNRDLFTEDNPDDPVITKRGLEAGIYFDAVTGKVIRHVKDIKGAVKDAEGNIILKSSEFAKGLRDQAGEVIELSKGLLQRGMRKGMDVADWAKDRFMSSLGLPGQILGMGYNAGKRALDYIPDIYLPENLEVPVLTRRGLKAGAYFNKQGEVIKHFRDINSDVLDANEEVVLEFKDLPRVVDRKGRPIRSIRQRGMDLLKKGLSKAKDLVKWGGRQAAKLPGQAKRLVGKVADVAKYGLMGRGTTGRSGDVIDGGAANTLDQILHLLTKYFASRGFKLPKLGQPKLSMGGPSADSGFGSRARKAGGDVKEKMSSIKAGVAEAVSEAMAGKGDLARDKFAQGKEKLKSYRDQAQDSVKSKGGIKGILAKLLGISEQEADDRMDDLSGTKRSIMERARDKKDALKERVGSWRNILDRRKAKKDGKVKPGTGPLKPAKDTSTKGMIGTIIGILGSAVGMLGGLLSIGGALVTGVSSIIGLTKALAMFKGGSDLVDVAGLPDGPDKDKKTKGGKKGWLSKAWSGAKWLGKGALAAGSLAWGLGSGLVTSGAVTTAATAVGTTVATVLSAPVLIGAAVIGGLAIGAYYTYSWISNKLTPMQRLRMSQYGLPISGNRDAYVQVAELEHLLTPHARISDSGEGTLSGQVDYAAIFKIFGIDAKDNARMATFNDWFRRRFKPVFFTHLALMKRFGNSKPLIEADKEVHDVKKYQYAKLSIIKDGGATSPVYMVGASPFTELGIETGMETINEVLEDFEDEFGHLEGKKEYSTRTRRQSGKYSPEEMAKRTGNTQGAIDALESKGDLTPEEASRLATLKAKRNETLKEEVKKAGDKGTTSLEQAANERKEFLASLGPDLGPGTTYGSMAANDDVDNSILRGLPNGTANGRPEGVEELIQEAARIVDVDPELLSKLAMQTSGYTTGKRDGSRQGMFQMDSATWRRLLQRHGTEYGLGPVHARTDLKAEVLLAAEYLKSNLEDLKSTDVTDATIKLAHYVGSDKAKSMIGLPEDTLAKDFISPADRDRFKVGDDTTIAQFIARLGQVQKEVAASNYVKRGPATTTAPQSDNVVDIRKRIDQSRQAQVAQTTQVKELRARQQQLKEVREQVSQSNSTRKSLETNVHIESILGESLTVQMSQETILLAVEAHLRNLSMQLLERGVSEDDLEPVELPNMSAPTTQAPKSRVPSKRTAI